MQHLLYHHPFEKSTLSSLPVQFRSAIDNHNLGIVEGRLVFYETVIITVNKICRIVVPVSLRHTKNSLLHASPTTGHRGEYKTLYRIKLQLFWLKLRYNINRWIEECLHCQLTFRWRRRGQLMFSWPLSILFAMLYVDFWMPGKFTDSKGNTALINSMCDMSQFVVIEPVPDKSSTTLADHFFQHVLMKFCLCYLVVLDDGNLFKGAFVAMCKSLKLNYGIFANLNHKGLSVEHFHNF